MQRKTVTRNGLEFEQVIDFGNPDEEYVRMSITRAKLNKGPYYFTLDLKYELETPSEIREIHLPAVRLPLDQMSFWIGVDHSRYGGHVCDDCKVDVGFGITDLDVDADGHAYYERVIKTKTKEMTLEEIEKKLGHKVKIVNK